MDSNALGLSQSFSMNPKLDTLSLKRWFSATKRDLPWRQTDDPYAIWVSEVMLQQTQVSVVIPYYFSWMEQFPTIKALACAPLDKVLKAWEGLGYYSRARNLHEGAQFLVEHHQGILPPDEEALKKIKGLGPYTIGAILSFAFHQKKAAVDGNVLRVLTRYFGIEEDISKTTTVNRLRALAQEILPDEEPWIINEALIELGATACQKKARCTTCPLSHTCIAFREDRVSSLPLNSKKIHVEKLYRAVAVIQSSSHFLVRRGQKGVVMSDLYEFPYLELAQEEVTLGQIERKVAGWFSFPLVQKAKLEEVSHGFTRYQAYLYPTLYSCSERQEIEGYEWISYEALKELPFSSGHRRIFQQVSRLLLRV